MARDIVKKGLWAVIIIHCILFLLKVLIISTWDLELHYEEAQYWLWGKHIDWSYYSKPGMVAWMNALSAGLFGDTELAVKLPALIAGWLMGIGTYILAIDMYNDYKLALTASLILYLMPFFYSVTFFHSTDTFLCCFLLFSLLFLQKAIKNDRLLYFLLFGLFFGLAMLAKYAAIFIIPFSISILALHTNLPNKAWRNWALAIGFGLLLCIPIVIWNAQHDWVTFKHIFALGNGNSSNSFSITNVLNPLAEYIGGQVLIISPFLVLLYLFYKKPSISKEKRRFLCFFPIYSFVFFLFITIFKQKAANVNWSMFGYVTLPIFFAVAFKAINWKKWFLPMALVQVIFIAWIAFFKQGNLLPITFKKDPRMTYVGWKEMANAAWEEKQKSPDPKNTIIVSSNYKTASAVSFYLQDKTTEEVLYVSNGSRMNQHLIWDDIQAFANKPELTVIYIDKNPIKDIIKNQFGDVISKKEHTVEINHLGEKRFFVYTLKGSKAFDVKPAGY